MEAATFDVETKDGQIEKPQVLENNSLEVEPSTVDFEPTGNG